MAAPHGAGGDPQNYTSYDYGAAITEARQFDPKYYEDKRIGYLVDTPRSWRRTIWRRVTDNPRVLDRAHQSGERDAVPSAAPWRHDLHHG
jgi:hypothetical protein